MEKIIFFSAIFIIAFGYLLQLIANILEYKNMQYNIPDEFKDIYSSEKYNKSQQYKKDNIKLDIVSNTFSFLLILVILLTNVLNDWNNFILSYNFSPIVSGIIFIGGFLLFMDIVSMPFSLYYNFKLENKYGFNKMTPGIFFTDKLKSYFLMLIIGVPVLALTLYFFIKYPDSAWLYAMIFFILFQTIMIFIAPYIIFPLFNKFTPLDNIELKKKILEYFNKVNVKLKGVFVMDGSKRSTKSNAFFTGFGSSKRIVLYDTLIEKFTNDEIIAILAHETGHYKKKHIFLHLIISIAESALMFFLLSIFISNELVYKAFGIEQPQIYIGFLLFGIFYSPIGLFLSLITNKISRSFEKQADLFAIQTIENKKPFIDALKKLSVDNLVNLTPHRLNVVLEYSHPPMIERIRYIKQNASE